MPIANTTRTAATISNGVLLCSSAARMRANTDGNLPHVAALGGRHLALVMRAQRLGTVRALRGLVERHERQLRDQQPWVQLDGHTGEVVELERQRALPAR